MLVTEDTFQLLIASKLVIAEQLANVLLILVIFETFQFFIALKSDSL